MSIFPVETQAKIFAYTDAMSDGVYSQLLPDPGEIFHFLPQRVSTTSLENTLTVASNSGDVGIAARAALHLMRRPDRSISLESIANTMKQANDNAKTTYEDEIDATERTIKRRPAILNAVNILFSPRRWKIEAYEGNLGAYKTRAEIGSERWEDIGRRLREEYPQTAQS